MKRNYRCIHHQQNTKHGRENLDTEDMIEETDPSVKENVKSNKFLTKKSRKSGTP